MYAIVYYYLENSGRYKDNPQLRYHIMATRESYDEIYDYYLTYYEEYKRFEATVLFYPSLGKEILRELWNEKVIKEDKAILTIQKMEEVVK